MATPDDSGIIVQSNDEPNCGGEEEHCLYDGQVIVQLSTGVNQVGQTVPQLTIGITVYDAWDEPGVAYDSQSYVLNWTGRLPDAILYYLNVEIPADLGKIVTDCKTALAKLGYDDNSEYINFNDVCPYAQAFKYRDDFETAFDALKEDWVGKKEADNVKLLSVGEVTSKIFDSARALAKNFKKGKSKITSKMIKQQLDIVEAYTLSKNKVYAIEYGSRSQSLYVVDSTNSTIVHFNIRVSDPSN